MVLVSFLAAAHASSCLPDPRGPEHPMLSSSVVVVGTIGEQTLVPAVPNQRSIPRVRVSVRVSEVIKGDPALRELTVSLHGMDSIGQAGTTVLLHLVPHWLDVGSYYFAGRSCFRAPAIERREAAPCGAVAYTHGGALIATYPTDTRERPSTFDVGDDLGIEIVNGRAVNHQPTPEELCGGMLWDELLGYVREAAASSSIGR